MELNDGRVTPKCFGDGRFREEEHMHGLLVKESMIPPVLNIRERCMKELMT